MNKLKVSDHHPSCECGSGYHYEGCQLKNRDAKTAEDWWYIAAVHLQNAERAEATLDREREFSRQARRNARRLK